MKTTLGAKKFGIYFYESAAMAVTSLIYKYMDTEGARKTISNSTLKFTRPSEMNDPFDVNIYDLYNLEINELMHEHCMRQHDLLLTDPKAYALETGTEVETAIQRSKMMNNVRATAMRELRSEFAAASRLRLDQDLSVEMAKLDADRLLEVEKFKNTGIFCATKNNSNLLMWAHYAEKHYGVVLGFRPDSERDSFLRQLESVVYTNKRPKYYESITNWKFETDKAKQQQIGAGISRRMIYSKSNHWAYEVELRLHIPSAVKHSEPASFFKFYPSELVEVYFGCRMLDDVKTEIVGLAKKLNPSVRIFTARLAKDTYDLEFDESLTV